MAARAEPLCRERAFASAPFDAALGRAIGLTHI
jgi:hypothetical protein